MFAFSFLSLHFACPMAIFVYSMCALLRHFASTFNIFSFFAYQKKKKGLNRIIEIMLMATVFMILDI